MKLIEARLYTSTLLRWLLGDAALLHVYGYQLPLFTVPLVSLLRDWHCRFLE